MGTQSTWGVRNRQRKKSMKALVLPLLMVHLCSALTGSHVKVSIGGVSYSHGNKVDSPFHNSFPAFKSKTVASLNITQNQPNSSKVNNPPNSPMPTHVTSAAPTFHTTPTTPTTPTIPTTPSTPSTTKSTPTPNTSRPSTLATLYFTSPPSNLPETAKVHLPKAQDTIITPIYENPKTVYKSSIRFSPIPEATIAQSSQTVSKLGPTPIFNGALQYHTFPESLQQTRKARLWKMLEIFQNKSKTISQSNTTPKYNAALEYKTTLKYNAALEYNTTPKYDAAQKYNTTPKHTAALEYNTISFNKAEPEYQPTPLPKKQTRKTRLQKIRDIFDKYVFYNQSKTEDK